MATTHPMIERGQDGRIYIYGYALVGHILPLFGFQDFNCLKDGEIVLDDPNSGPPPDYLVKCRETYFCIEWLGYGWAMGIFKRESD